MFYKNSTSRLVVAVSVAIYTEKIITLLTADSF